MQTMIRRLVLASLAVTVLTAAPGGYADDQDGQTSPLIFVEEGAEVESGAETGDSHVLTWEDGRRFEGRLSDDTVPEYGVMTWPDGRRYEGHFYGNFWGTPHGKGEMEWPDGRRFKGGFNRGALSSGVLSWPDGMRYKGGFLGYTEVEDHWPFSMAAHGRGVCTMPDGRRIEGYWLYGGRYEGEVNEDGKPHGQGVLVMPDGTRFEGEFSYSDRDYWVYGPAALVCWIGDGQPLEPEWRCFVGGSGGVKTLERPDGSTYVGLVRDGYPHGQGILAWRDGKRYVGGFRDGKPHGQGVLTWPEGRYVGGFQGGVQHGHGVMTYSDGRRSEGEWREGKFHENE